MSFSGAGGHIFYDDISPPPPPLLPPATVRRQHHQQQQQQHRQHHRHPHRCRQGSRSQNSNGNGNGSNHVPPALPPRRGIHELPAAVVEVISVPCAAQAFPSATSLELAPMPAQPPITRPVGAKTRSLSDVRPPLQAQSSFYVYERERGGSNSVVRVPSAVSPPDFLGSEERLLDSLSAQKKAVVTNVALGNE